MGLEKRGAEGVRGGTGVGAGWGGGAGGGSRARASEVAQGPARARMGLEKRGAEGLRGGAESGRGSAAGAGEDGDRESRCGGCPGRVLAGAGEAEGNEAPGSTLW